MQTRAFRVTGRVQGVGYRAWTCRTAAAHGVTGWVRNIEDGTVEGRVQGLGDVLDRFIAALHQGPRFAQVTSVRARDVDDETLSDFVATATAAAPTDDWR